MPRESVQWINQQLRQPKRRFRLVADEHGKGRVERYVPGQDDDPDDERNEARPGAEKPMPRPWAGTAD